MPTVSDEDGSKMGSADSGDRQQLVVDELADVWTSLSTWTQSDSGRG